MNHARMRALRDLYRDALLQDSLPFWERHAIDREHGGFLFCRDRDGGLVDTDKGLWQHARYTWLLGLLCDEVEDRVEWRDLCEHGVAFMRSHAFDRDGRMWFQVTREGAPLRKRRYFYTEAFGAIAFAAWARVSGESDAADTAWRLLRLYVDQGPTDPRWPAKYEDTRPMRSLGTPMIGISTAQELRRFLPDRATECDLLIDQWVDDIRSHFMHHEEGAVLEQVGPRGQILDHAAGRPLNPGHAIEASWFLLREALHRGLDAPGSAELVKDGCQMLDWMWGRGWDDKYGGIFSFRDLRGLPVQEYWHDMKFWWPHAEAILATLHAHVITGEPRYARWHEQVHDWSHQHFADPEHGEWFGYLHRDGRRSVTTKGDLWKGPFHVPRMQLFAWRLLDAHLDQEPDGRSAAR